MGRPMFETTVRSFPPADRYVFICLQEHFNKYKLKHHILGAFKNTDIIVLDDVTEGQACTCLLAEHLMDRNDGLFIASCDYQTEYDRERYGRLMKDDDIDVIIWTFRIGNIKMADPGAFAYCVTEGDRVTEVVEKRTISDDPFNDPAVVGSFTYKKADLFLRSANRMIHKNIRVNNEFYVGTSVNQLIEEGAHVVTFEVDRFISFGNPFELQVVQYWEEYFDQLEDHPFQLSKGVR